jgi:hypothetical protein
MYSSPFHISVLNRSINFRRAIMQQACKVKRVAMTICNPN